MEESKLTSKYKVILSETDVLSAHEVQRILFVKQKRDCRIDEMQTVLKDLEPFLKQDEIDNVVFVETDEKYRIKEKEKQDE